MSKCWYCNNELITDDNPKHFGICNKCYDEMFKNSDTIIRSFTNKIADVEAKLAESEEQLKEELVEKKGLERALSACNRQNDEFAEMIKKLVREKEELKEQLANQNQDQQITELRELHAIKDDASECITINGVKFSYEQMLIIDEVNNNYSMNIKKLNQQLKQQIADLEAKLAESEKKAYSRGHSQRDIANEIKLNALREDVANKEKRIVELKQQLAECEEKKESYRLQNDEHHLQLLQFYSRLGVEAFGADIHEKALETLMIMKEQLEEKEKEISEYIKIVDDLHKQLSDKCDFCDKTKDQDKISFTIQQLEKVKELLNTDFESTISWIDPYEDGEYLNSMTYNHNNTIKIIDNQIKQLKEMK